MFRATIDTNVLQSSIKSMAAFIDESVFTIDENGITSRAVDPANAGLASIDLPATQCTIFDATDCELGIDLARFTEILGMATKSDEIILELDEDTHKLGMSFDGFVYMMALLDPVNMRKSPLIPELDLPAEIAIDGATFKRMVKAAAMTSNHMRMGVQEETFFMESVGDNDKVRLDLSGSELISLKSADVSSLYALDYLTDMVKGVGSANEVTIHLGRDLPVVIDFEPSEDCPVAYVLAPRIESD